MHLFYQFWLVSHKPPATKKKGSQAWRFSYLSFFPFSSASKHTGAKILNSSKNSYFENLIFHKIHAFKNLILHKIHMFGTHFFTKFTFLNMKLKGISG